MNTGNSEVNRLSVDVATKEETAFRGYTIDELRYQRALVALQAEFCKEKLLGSIGELRRGSPIGNAGGALRRFSVFRNSGIVNKVAKSLNFFDYAILGISAYKSIRAIFSKFKKK